MTYIDSWYRSRQSTRHLGRKRKITMLKFRNLVLTSIFVAATGLSWGAIPECVGSFTGNIKLNTYNRDGSKSKTTVQLQLDIAADDSTTVTFGGVVVPAVSVALNGPNGFLLVSAVSGLQIYTFQVKKTSIKGVIQQVTGSSPETVVVSDGKFKLKKSN
jgi:hypothetical protein